MHPFVAVGHSAILFPFDFKLGCTGIFQGVRDAENAIDTALIAVNPFNPGEYSQMGN